MICQNTGEMTPSEVEDVTEYLTGVMTTSEIEDITEYLRTTFDLENTAPKEMKLDLPIRNELSINIDNDNDSPKIPAVYTQNNTGMSISPFEEMALSPFGDNALSTNQTLGKFVKALMFLR